MIEVDRDLKDMIISALRYALGRRTYITELTSKYIMNHPELMDKRVKQVMLKDLDEYFDCRGTYYNDDECDYHNWLRLYSWLDKLNTINASFAFAEVEK